MKIGERKLAPLAPFCGVTDGKTVSFGQIELPVTFGGRDTFRTENITFDVCWRSLSTHFISCLSLIMA